MVLLRGVCAPARVGSDGCGHNEARGGNKDRYYVQIMEGVQRYGVYV